MRDFSYGDWKAEEKREEFRSRRWSGGFVADLPHPYTTSQGSVFCDTCGGHADRRIHDAPWQKPVYGPCPLCRDSIQRYPAIQCDMCGDTRESWERVGVEEVLPVNPTPPKRRSRPWSWMGPKRKRRKGHLLPGWDPPTKENRTRLNRRDRHKTKAALDNQARGL